MFARRISRVLDVAGRSSARPRLLRPSRQFASKSTAETRSTWTTPKIALLTGFASALAYAYGVMDSGSHIQELWNLHHTPTYGSEVHLNKAVSELRALLGEDIISTDEEDLHAHGFSEWSTVNSKRLPVAVAYPRSTEEVSQIAKVCHKYRMPMIPYSGGSSLEGHFSAPHGGMSIDFAYMDQIVAFHEDDMDIVVQPSIHWMALNEKIKDSGLFFPVDPGPTAKIGGMIGTNCSGTNAVRYGTMKDWVVNLTVVLADGRVIKTRRRPRKSSAGYNLTGLFIGSEGTLGIVTEATLKLAVRPEKTAIGVVVFDTIRNAAAAAVKVMRVGVPIGAMEILDDVQMDVINRAGATGRTWKVAPTLFFKFSGTKSGVQDNADTVKRIVKQYGGSEIEFTQDEAAGERLWSARKNAAWSMLAIANDDEGSKLWSTDVAVPLSRLADIIEVSKKDMDELGLFASILGHIGDGNFHEAIIYNDGNKESVEHSVHNMVNRALEMDGTCSGEHGVGLGKKKSLMRELGPETIEVMRCLKRALDPHWLLNPGKIFEANASDSPKDAA